MRAIRPLMKTSIIALAATAAVALSLNPLHPSSQQTPSYLSTASSEAHKATQSSVLSPQHLVAEAAPLSTNSTGSVHFRQTGHSVKDAFLNYWLMEGGAALYGYPISQEFTKDGVLVQYFERARFEYRAGSSRPWKVELTNVGRQVTDGRDFPPPAERSSTGDRVYYEQTGHTLRGAFAQFWQKSGGLPIFGYPISEEIQERGMTVQYFERARFELMPNGSIQLGRLGVELLDKHLAAGLDKGVAASQPRPGYHMSFRGEATVFNANWERVIDLNKGWGNLPDDYVGQGLYAAAPADLGLYGRWARVTRGNRSIFVQFIDVINWPDIPYVRSKGIVIDLAQEAYRALGTSKGGRYEVSFDVFWPGEGP